MPGQAAPWLTLDCSTTAAKAVAFDERGRQVAAASVPLRLDQPHPGWREQDPEQWWDASRQALRGVVERIDPAGVQALCLTHQRESFVCLDADAHPLRPAILWMDTRAGDEIRELGSPLVAQLSGKPPDVTPSLYKMAWLARHEPDVLKRAHFVGDAHAFLAQRLTGRWAAGRGSLDALGLFDLRAGEWSDDLVALAGVRRDQLPDALDSGTLVAPVGDRVSSELGLPAGVPLVAGIGDGQAAALGSNALAPGTAYLNLGTSMVMGSTVGAYSTDPAYRTLAGAESGTYVLETLLNAAGYLVTWFAREFGADEGDEAAAARLAPGCDGLLTVPYWNAVQSPYWDPEARGATIGWTGHHTRAHFYRSLLEGVAYELRLQLSGLPHSVDVLHAVGGGTRSALWTQIVADVTGLPVVMQTESEISAKGAAVLAAAYLHRESTRSSGVLCEVAAELATPGRTIAPDATAAAAYEHAYQRYRTVYPALTGKI